MKTCAFPFFAAALRRAFALFILLAGAALPLHAAGLSLSQGSITNSYTGILTLTITGLDSAGESVVIEEYLDVDGSGTVTAGDLLLRKYTVTDGQITSIGGQRNLNIPSDDDLTADGKISTHFTYGLNDIVHLMDGVHIFRVSPSGAGFTPVTQSLTVTQQAYAGSGISGQVMGASAGQAHALVMLQTPGNDGNAVAMTLTDASGNFSIKAPAGSYQLLPSKSGFVYNRGTAPTITVPAGSFLTGQTQTLTPASRTISGKVRNATTLAGVPGLGTQGQSQTGWAAITLTDGSGNFVSDATTEAWQIGGAEQYIATFGLLRVKTTAGSGASSVTGFNVDLPQATALIYGSLKTPANVPVAFAEINAETNGNPAYKSITTTDANGNYTLNAAIGAWRVGSPQAGYVVQELNVTVNTAGSAVLQNLVANPVTAHLRGQVVDNHGNPVGNVQVNANTFDPANPNGNAYGPVVTADANGYFDCGVFGGGGTATRAWQLGLNFGNTPLPYVPTTPTFNVQDGVDTNGISYLVYQVTAHLRGQVLDENNAPIGNIGMYGSLSPNGGANAGANVDAGGNFDLPVFGGSWNLGLSNIGGLGITPQDFPISVTDGTDQNGLVFRAIHTTATIAGSVKGPGNVAIAGVTVTCTATSAGNTYANSTTTNAGGNYSIPVFSSTWSVGVDASGLMGQSYNPVASQNVFVGSGTVLVNFTATSAQTYTVTPSTNGNGSVTPNSAQVVGSGGSIAFTASPNSGYVVNQWTVDGSAVQTGGTSFTLGNVTGNHAVQVTFQSAGLLTVQSWRQAWYATTANSGNAADTADPYQRGVRNLAALAYFGPGQNPASAQISQLPAPHRSGTNIVYSFTQPAGVSGLTYGAQSTTSLNPANWQPVTDTGSGGVHTFSVPIGANTKLFLRLTVSYP